MTKFERYLTYKALSRIDIFDPLRTHGLALSEIKRQTLQLEDLICTMPSTSIGPEQFPVIPFHLPSLRLACRILDHTLPNTLPIRFSTPISRLERIHCQVAQEWSHQPIHKLSSGHLQHRSAFFLLESLDERI